MRAAQAAKIINVLVREDLGDIADWYKKELRFSDNKPPCFKCDNDKINFCGTTGAECLKYRNYVIGGYK